uniref:Uncharacterized protein n=1 Tax=Meloidogyne floridensis TaxID=298350 RepID=A0A915NTQ3_9BILA
MFIYLIIFLLLPTTPTTNALPNLLTKANPLQGICNVYNTMTLIYNPLNGSAEKSLEKYFKEFLSTEDPKQINKIYMQISILSQVFLIEIALDRAKKGDNTGLFARFTMLCPVNFILPYEIRLCDIVATFKSEYKKLVEQNFEKKIRKYSPMDCLHADDEKMKKIFLEFQEEIWEANFIVFFKYFIYEKGESFQQFLRYVLFRCETIISCPELLFQSSGDLI